MSFGRVSKYVIWAGVQICHLVGCRNMSFGRASKYVILSGVEICHFVGRRNMSFSRVSKYVIWSGDELCYFLRPKNVQNISFRWGQNLSFGRVLKIVHCIGISKKSYICRNYIIFFCTNSYYKFVYVKKIPQKWSLPKELGTDILTGRGIMSFGRASKYVIWSCVEICHLVGRQNMSFGWASKHVICFDVEICHFVGC